jgi:hypothetical protein
MPVTLSNWSKDTFIAPEMSRFTEASIPDMSATDDEQEYWLANFILNNMLSSSFVSPVRQQMYNFLRRSHAAFAEYALARDATRTYLDDPDRVLAYIEAINHWEGVLANAWQAYCFLGRSQVRWFAQNDGSVLQRLNALHNRSKHADEAIERGDFVEDSPLCVWLTNSGLSSTETQLTFDEIAEILTDIARWASAIQDPGTAVSKIKAYRAEQ